MNVLYLVLDGLRFSGRRSYFSLGFLTYRLYVVRIVMSSANFTNIALLSQLLMSLAYIKNSTGPNMQPWGTTIVALAIGLIPPRLNQQFVVCLLGSL